VPAENLAKSEKPQGARLCGLPCTTNGLVYNCFTCRPIRRRANDLATVIQPEHQLLSPIPKTFFRRGGRMPNHPPIRQQLTARYGEIQQRLEKITREVRHVNQPLNADFAEQAVEAENDQVLDALDHSIRSEMQQIENTLARMDEGLYGICEACGKPIAAKRLKAVPHAARCVQCEEKFHQQI
jgi:DnaK suppressor protein